MITVVIGNMGEGGAERVLSYLIRHWSDSGWEIELITRSGPEKDNYPIPEQVKRTVLHTGGKPKTKFHSLFKHINHIIKLRAALKKSRNRVVLSFLTKHNIYTILASLWLNKKIIISERNDTTRQHYPGPWDWLRQKLYRRAEWVTANSIIGLHGMSKYVEKDKMKVIYNPVFKPDQCAEPEHSNIILNVGRLEAAKNHSFLLNGAKSLSHLYTEPWTIQLIGDGSERKKLESQLIWDQLTDRVQLKGYIEQVGPYYESAAIFVMTSHFEGTPNALLEAMSYGLPAIIPDNLPGAMEWVRHEETGLVYESGNLEMFINSLLLLLKNPNLRKTYGTKAREIISECNPANIFEQWDELITLE